MSLEQRPRQVPKAVAGASRRRTAGKNKAMMSDGMDERRVDLESNEQDLLIARLKAEAFELSSKVRDYDALNQEYLGMQAKFQGLVEEFKRNKSGLASHEEHQSNIAYFMKKTHDENAVARHNLEIQQDQASSDYIGLKKSGDAKMRTLQSLKHQLHKKVDIVHMLNGEMQEKEEDLQDQKVKLGELKVEENSLLQLTNKNEQKLQEVRDELSVAKGERDGLQGRVEDAQQQLMKWTVEERLIEKEIEANHNKIKEHNETLKETKYKNEKTQERIEAMAKNKDEYQERLDDVRPLNEQCAEDILKYEKEVRELNYVVAEYEKEKDKHKQNLRDHEKQQILLTKELNNQQRIKNALQERNEKYNEELELMIKTDLLVRERLDRRDRVQMMSDKNQSSLRKARQDLVNRERSGSGSRVGAPQGFICGKEQGLQTLGAIDGNLLNPFRARHDNLVNEEPKQQEQYYSAIQPEQANNLASQYGQQKLRQLNSETFKENALEYKYESQDQELRNQANRVYLEGMAQRATSSQSYEQQSYQHMRHRPESRTPNSQISRHVQFSADAKLQKQFDDDRRYTGPFKY